MRVYLDNSATTAAAREVIDAMLPYLSEEFGNAQSVHSFGQRARAAIEQARRQVAALINAVPGEIVFVSGGTEADNMAIRGLAEASQQYGRHIITTKIEHPAVLAACELLERSGFTVTYLPVSRLGLIDLDELRAAITEQTILISVMHANNETGTLQPIEQIGAIVAKARERGLKHLRFHTDAVQSAGKVRIDVKEAGLDLLSISSHKIHGPKGVGALYVRKGVRLKKLIYGGHHERDRRAGTENVAGIVGLGRAAELARTELDARAQRMRELRDHLQSQICARIVGAKINGDLSRRLPNVLNMSFEGLDGESLLIALDLSGVAVSTGSACSSGSLEPSHVLTALGLSREEVRGSLRFSLSAYTTREEIDYAIRALEQTIARLRDMQPREERGALEAALSSEPQA